MLDVVDVQPAVMHRCSGVFMINADHIEHNIKRVNSWILSPTKISTPKVATLSTCRFETSRA